jgi:glycosyltransferase involved in cell wall biosynthesis
MNGSPTAGTAKPLIFVLDASIDITGALIAARRQAGLLRGEARFMLVLPAASRVPDAALPEFERVIRLPMVDLRRSWRAVLLYGPALLVAGYRLARALRRHDCRRLQGNDFHLMQAAAARLFGYRGTILTWVRFDPARYGPIGRVWLRVGRSVSARMVAVSRFIIGRLPPGIDAELLYDPPPQWPLVPASPANPQRIIFVGNYIEGKGQDVAIRAFARIAPRFETAVLAFHGGDMGLDKNRAYRVGLEALAAESGLGERIMFNDFAADTRSLLSDGGVALNCSQSESFSFTCLEASMAGLPVIATRSGGPEEIIDHGHTGFLVDIADWETIAERLAWLFDHPLEAAAMGRSGQSLVAERFSVAHFQEQIRALLDI